MTPYFQDHGVTLYCGDAREVLPTLDLSGAAIITDPVWPNARTDGPLRLAGAEDPAGLFAAVAPAFAAARLLIVILGCNCDPRFLASVPASLPFARVTKLRHACPSYAGPVLLDGDVAYCFGRLRLVVGLGQRVVPGEIVSTAGRSRELWQTVHPCPRSFQHVDGLVAWYAAVDEVLVDPFAGSGTLVESAVRRGRRVIACEVREDYCAEIVERVAFARQQLDMFRGPAA